MKSEVVELIRGPGGERVGRACATAWGGRAQGYQITPTEPAGMWNLNGRFWFRFPDGTERQLRLGRPAGVSWLDGIPVED